MPATKIKFDVTVQHVSPVEIEKRATLPTSQAVPELCVCDCVLQRGGEAGQGQGSAELRNDGVWQSASWGKRFVFAALQDYLDLAPGPASTAIPEDCSA